LAAAFGHNARQSRQGSDVRELVEGEQESGALMVAVIGCVHELFDETDDEWD
jgi:hypothetical protein